MTGKRISSGDERRLTSAVERAATLASGDAGKDRNELLAKCLLDGGVDSRFAKAASAAFNKRVSVLTFQKANDDNRADSFPLSDAGKVGELMGVKSGEKKCAAFSVGMAESGALKKAASGKRAVSRVNYEDRVSPEVFERHLVSQLQKLAHDHSALLGALAGMHKAERAMCKEAGAALRAMPAGQVCALQARYGRRLDNVIPSADQPHWKAIADAVLADTPELHKVAGAIMAHERYVEAHNAMVTLQDYLSKAASASEDLGKALHKRAGVGELAGGAYLTMKALTDGTVGMASALNDMRESTTDNLASAYGAASGLLNTDRESERPGKILDSAFLVKDRAADRLLAFSDMSADPLLANQTTAGELFAATNKAIDLDPRLERPDQRELLRVYVAKLLAQNGRMDDAGMAALSSIEGQLGRAPDVATVVAAAPVHALDKVEAPDLPVGALDSLVKILGHKESVPEKIDLSTLEKIDTGAKNLAKSKKEKAKSEKENRAAALKAIGIRVGLDSKGAPVNLLGGGKGGKAKELTDAQVDALVTAYNQLQR